MSDSEASVAQPRPFRPLNRRIVAWALLYSTIFTLAMTAVLFGADYLEERDNAIAQLRFAAESHRRSLANNLWDLDMPAAQLELEGIAGSPLVGQVVLTTTLGQTLQVGKRGGAAADELSWKEKLLSPEHPERVVGQLQLFVDRPAFLQRIQSNALRILIGEAIKGAVLALAIAWLISKLVTRHLSHMAAQVASLHPTALGAPLVLPRRHAQHEDELDRLCGAFNQLNRQLLEYFDSRRLLEEELRGHRDRLADMVSERTRSLERLRGFHGLVIRVLTRFINLPPGQASEAVDHGLSTFGDYFGAQRCLLLTYDAAVHGFSIVNAWPSLAARGGEDDVFLSEELLPRRLLADRKSRIWLSNTAGNGEDRLLTALGTTAYTAVGVEIKGNTVGLLCMVGRAVPQGSDNASLLELAARVSANMLDHKAAQTTLLETQQALQTANRELHSLSRHDPLTGLANRRHFDEIKEVEFRRALRAEWPLSVLMCDVDEFKRYNDTYGHAQGDRCLIAIAECAVPLFGRAGELLVRLGGEEFAVLLPNTDREQAKILAERLRQAVWELELPHASSSVSGRVTVSVGIACLRHGWHKDFDALLQDADLALYRAKNGRNRTVLAE
jgi:diguanylate cyclase (GGDEF)-like protein